MYQIDDRIFNMRQAQLLDAVYQNQAEHDYGTTEISFSSGFLRSEEWYKRKVLKKAKQILGTEFWDASIIGSGSIVAKVKEILHLKDISERGSKKEQNILDWRDKQYLEQRMEEDTIAMEAWLYHLFTGTSEVDDRQCFYNLMEIIGERFPIISFLFFIKDSRRYMPVRPRRFSVHFKTLGIKTFCTKGCSWDNYTEYMEILKDVQVRIDPFFPEPVKLIDAHSFVWMMWMLENAPPNASDEEAFSLVGDIAEYSTKYQTGDSELENLRQRVISDFNNQRDRDYPRKFSQDVKISVEDWKSMLKNERVFRLSDRELMKRFYRADNHALACYDLGLQDGKAPTSYVTPVVKLAQRISEWVSLDPIYGENGKRVWWRILFLGRYREDNRFEWKLQINLAEAVKALFPELDIETANAVEDELLTNDLRSASLAGTDGSFIYEPGELPRPGAVLSEAYSIYPRDLKKAINALAHANYECEVDRTHRTFIRRRSDKKYTEPHHLVPMAFQGMFRVSIDREQNIVSLCSSCHNEIHYGRDAGKLIKKLYVQRKDALESVGIQISLDRLLAMYGIRGMGSDEH